MIMAVSAYTVLFVIASVLLQVPSSCRRHHHSGHIRRGNITKGNNTQGNITQGNNTQGNITQGDITQGNTTQGCITQGNITQGNNTHGNITQGDITQGNITQGDITQGNITQGNNTHGNITQGDITQGNITQGDITQGNITQGNNTHGNITQGDIMQGNITQGDITQGNNTQGNITQGNITQGNNTQGSITQGNITQGSNTHDNITQGDVTQGNITQGSTTQGNTTQGNITQGGITQGNITQGDITQGNITQGDITQGNITQDDIMQDYNAQDNATQGNITQSDVELLDFVLNLLYLEAEFFLFGSNGYGLDGAAPNLTMGGPTPIEPMVARLDPFTNGVIYQFGLQKIGHIRAILNAVPGIPRPLINLSRATFAVLMNMAVGVRLMPPFDPYANTINYLLASYVIPYVSLTGLVGVNALLNSSDAKTLVAGQLGVSAGQDAVIRTLLYQKATTQVRPYRLTVAEFTYHISELRNSLGGEGVKDESIVGPLGNGPEGSSWGNVLAGDEYSLSYGRTPQEILRILYVRGDESMPGGFYPNGANGAIARSYLNQSQS